MSDKNKKWKKYIIRTRAEDGSIEGIYPGSSAFPPIPAQTIASRARAKNKTPDSEGLEYWWWEDYETENPDLLHQFLLEKVYNPASIPPLPEPMTLNLALTIGGKIVSINDLYKARLVYVGGKPKPAIYKNPKAKEVSAEIFRQLSSVDLTPWIPWVESTKAFKISIQFVVKTGISRRDTENLGKSIIDTVVRHIRTYSGITHFDDSEFLEVYFTKSIIPGARHEYALINLSESNHNPRFDYIPSPKKFYIGGEMGEGWREEIMGELEKKGKEWYVPELDLWSPERWSMEREKGCNTELYIFDLGKWEERKEEFRSILGKLREFSLLKPHDRFLYVGWEGTLGIGGEERWLGEEIQKSLELNVPGLVVKYLPYDASPKELLEELT